MCLYHEENPTVKQRDIGAIFGVERSMVSKVLRQKEKYLHQNDGNRSAVKRPKGKRGDRDARGSWRSRWDNWYSHRSPSPTTYSIQHKSRYSRSPSIHSRASSYGSFGSVDSGVSHPPRAGIRRKQHVDMTYTEFAKPASEKPTNNFQRPRSQTFPLLIGAEQYMSPPASSEAVTPEYANITALDSPMDDAMQASPTMATDSIQPPSIPTARPTSISMQRATLSAAAPVMTETSPTLPSQEEAAQALELVWTFFQQQDEDFVVEPQEFLTIGKLMEKLKRKRNSESVLSGIRHASQLNFGNGGQS